MGRHGRSGRGATPQATSNHRSMVISRPRTSSRATADGTADSRTMGARSDETGLGADRSVGAGNERVWEAFARMLHTVHIGGTTCVCQHATREPRLSISTYVTPDIAKHRFCQPTRLWIVYRPLANILARSRDLAGARTRARAFPMVDRPAVRPGRVRGAAEREFTVAVRPSPKPAKRRGQGDTLGLTLTAQTADDLAGERDRGYGWRGRRMDAAHGAPTPGPEQSVGQEHAESGARCAAKGGTYCDRGLRCESRGERVESCQGRAD